MKKVFYLIIMVAVFGVACSEGTDKTANATENYPAITEESDDFVQIQDEETEKAAEQNIKSQDNKGKVVKMDSKLFIEQVLDYKTATEWDFNGDKPTIIDFYADWCGPCKQIAPIMAEIASEYANEVNIYKVDVDVEKELASIFGIQSIPAILYIPVEGEPQIVPGFKPKSEVLSIMAQQLNVTTK